MIISTRGLHRFKLIRAGDADAQRRLNEVAELNKKAVIAGFENAGVKLDVRIQRVVISLLSQLHTRQCMTYGLYLRIGCRAACQCNRFGLYGNAQLGELLQQLQ